MLHDPRSQFSRLAGEVIQRADIITCTPAVVASDDLQAKTFDDIINNETSVTMALKTLTAWRSNETLIMIGDDLQLAPPVFTGPNENPFHQTIATSIFARFHNLIMPAFLLKELMGMPAEMIHLSNDIIYGGKLIDEKGTALADNRKARDLKTYINEMYPSLQQEPEHLVYIDLTYKNPQHAYMRECPDAFSMCSLSPFSQLFRQAEAV